MKRPVVESHITAFSLATAAAAAAAASV